MNKKYYDNISDEIKEYFAILSPEWPEWLDAYINIKEMQRIGTISMDCGNDYTNLFPKHPWYSNLDHSVGVALILWHFTHDKKQTLAGLFHDIATPIFKHCIDFMNDDYEKQESTEEQTTSIIKNSKEIMRLLERDGIKLEEVNDYKIYPLADNDTPKLSADRFEYNFSCAYIIHPIWSIDDLRECYNDITILTNEEGIVEFGFQHLSLAEKYIHNISKLCPWYINKEDRITMQFLADTCKVMNQKKYLSLKDLYHLPEKEIINKIENCEDKKLAQTFKKFEQARKCYKSDHFITEKYYINVKAKRRYINPLVKENNFYGRIYDLSKKAQKNIDNYMALPNEGYVYLDFAFEYEN